MSDKRTAEKQAILVAGYYRSGTSALCGSLADLGVQISSDAQSNEANPKGFFESTELIKFDIRVLELMGSYWSDLPPLPEGWIERADIQLQRDVLAEILSRQFSDAPLVAVKHPHICRLLPLYVQAVDDLGYRAKVLHTHRSPYAVATSQATKNNMTRAHAIALWASYITSAEHGARGLPRTWVQYQDLLHDADGTVRAALSKIGIEVAGGRNVAFVTKALNRSGEADAVGLYGPLAALAAEIEAAIATGAGPEVWDDLRARSADLAAFVDELGRSGNRSAPGVGQGLFLSTPAGRQVQLSGAAPTHPVRPSERGDSVEQARVLDLLKRVRQDNGAVPSLSILIACPEGATHAQIKDTLDSIARNWLQPDVKIAFGVATKFDFIKAGVTLDHQFDSDAEMTAALYGAMATARTDYVSIVNAGDLLEPDAIARFALRAAVSGADMIYCDEVAPSPGGPWIRAKPSMSLPRLLESCFVGDWVWYRRETVAAIGGFRPDRYPGAEEQDMQIRMVDAGRQIESLTEALFVRGDGTRRDAVGLETAMESARAAVEAHFARVRAEARVQPGSLPGLFAVDYAAKADPAVTLGILCAPSAMPDVAQQTVNRLLPHHDGTGSRIVFIRQEGVTAAMAEFLSKVGTEITPNHPSISVMDAAPTLGGTLGKLTQIAPGNHVALADPVSAPSDTDVLGSLAALLDAHEDAGVIAPLTFFRDGERTPRLQGPLLFGAGARIGDGYEATSPGPGGWLATTQPVDAVDGPLVMLRSGVAFRPEAETWAEVCATLQPAQGDSGTAGAPTFTAYWTPRRQIEIPGPSPATEVEAAQRIPYRGIHHHPAMTISGSPLILEGRPGLVDAGGVDHGATMLITSSDLGDDAKIICTARFARQHGGVQASIVAEPIDALSVLRAKRQGRRWLRINPKAALQHPGTGKDILADVNIWSVVPSESQRGLVRGAHRNVVTSRRLEARLRGMGARNVALQTPRLVQETWADFTPGQVKSKPVALWVEEHDIAVPWLGQLIEQTSEKVAWTVIPKGDQDFPGHVARRPLPVFQEDWARLFAETGASILIRPTPGANWCDDYLVCLALAGGCRVIAGNECEVASGIAPLVSKSLPSENVARWVKAILAMAGTDPDPRLRDQLLETPDVWLKADDEGLGWFAPRRLSEGETDAA